MDEIVASTTATYRFNALLFGIFAAVALALATVGVYGVLAIVSNDRQREIGIRMALGASRADVLHMFLKQGAFMMAVGLVVGLAGAAVASKSLSTLLYGVKSASAWNFIGPAVLMLVIGLLATYLPAARATKISPTAALRYE